MRRSSRRRVGLDRAGPIGQDFSGSCVATSRNSLMHDGATTATKSERFDAEWVPPCCCRVLTAASERLLATVNFGEFLFRDCPKRGTNNILSVDLGGLRRPKWVEKHRFGG